MSGLRRAQVYVTGLVVVALAIVVFLARRTPWPPPLISHRWGAFVALAGLVVLCETLPNLLLIRSDSLNRRGPVIRVSPASGPSIAVLAIFGLLPGILVGVAGTVADQYVHGPPLLKKALNVGQIVIYTAAGGVVGVVLGWPVADGRFDLTELAVFAAVATVRLGANLALLVTFELLLVGPDGWRNTWQSVADGLRAEVEATLVGPLIVIASFIDPLFVPVLIVPLMGALFVGRSGQVHDPTGLVNQNSAELRIAEHLTTVGTAGSAIVVGPDRFDELVERLGADVADRLSVVLAARMHDGFEDVAVFGRAGNDELLLFSPGAATDAHGEALARRAVQVLSEPFTLGSLTFSLGAIAGVAVAGPATSASELVRRAQVARRVARELGRPVEVYDEARMAPDAGRLELVEDLRLAVAAGAVDLHYQPIADIDRRRISGFEALLRWHHPTHGAMDATTTVRLAEPTPLLTSLTVLVLDRAITACAEWRRQPSYATYSVAVNISPRSLLDPDLPTVVSEALTRHGLPPAALTLELTETVLSVRAEESRAAMERLAELGVNISVDDLSGMASFSQLVDAPITEIKIDRRCVTTMLDTPGDTAAVRAIVGFANDIGLRVVAEGVEDDATWYRLDEYGCDAVQGHALAPAMPLDQLQVWLSENHYRHHGPHRTAPLGDVVPLRTRRPE